jgi:hypothetical protein
VFEHLRETLRDLMNGRVAPADRRDVLARMKDSLVQAKLALSDLRGGVEHTRKRLAVEQRELETVERRKRLAEGISDTETVAIADRYVKLHGERVAVLARKLEAQEAELSLVESEIEGMTTDFKAALAGVGSAASLSADGADPLGADEAESLRQQLDQLGRSRMREAAEQRADEMLAALKRRMGK